MKAFIRACSVAFGLVLASIASAWAQADPHHAWDALLRTYLVESADGINRFDYDGLRRHDVDRASLSDYIETLEAMPVSVMEPQDQFAYWANLYNAVTVRLIVDEAPANSIRQIRPRPWSIGPWGVDRVEVEGRELSLDDIEHGIMREQFAATLVHYAVNCASIGCPNLKPDAWRGDTLETDLEAAARAYINHPRGVRVTEDGLEVSRIYAWFQEDFGGDEAGVLAHLLIYAEPELAIELQGRTRISAYAYDWSLNDLDTDTARHPH